MVTGIVPFLENSSLQSFQNSSDLKICTSQKYTHIPMITFPLVKKVIIKLVGFVDIFHNCGIAQ